MNILPDTGITASSIPTPSQVVGNIGKEKEAMPTPSSEVFLKDLGKEMELPKEVVSAGVSMKPTVVSISPPVQRLGVKSAGQNVTVTTTSAISLPLADDQMAQGLHASISSSFRWLAEWCRHQLKVLGIVQ
ncbi:MAG: hypothetical protein V1917_03585 [Candidatus Gottesmanbacteria bacterium]